MVINNIKIVTPTKVIENGYIRIRGKKILSVGKGNFTGNDDNIIDGKGKIAMPGFVDLHIHGSAGYDFMEGSKEDIVKAATSLYKEGVTTFLATTLTSDPKSLERACKNINRAQKEAKNIYGIHLEGPYISVKYKGAQNEKYIRKPDIDELNHLCEVTHNNIRYITMAPEYDNSASFIENCVKHNIVVSAGHTNATFKDVEEAIKHGLTNTTHTHNAMSGHHHRNPGVVTAAMYFDNLFCEMICDGIHVCKDTIKTFYKIVGKDRFMIITDALKVKNSDIKEFDMFGLKAHVENGAAYLNDGPLAGSILTMDQGIRNVRDFTGASLVELSLISSTNQARSLHLNDRGRLAKGCLADIVLLDENLYVKDVYKLGNKVI